MAWVVSVTMSEKTTEWPSSEFEDTEELVDAMLAVACTRAVALVLFWATTGEDGVRVDGTAILGGGRRGDAGRWGRGRAGRRAGEVSEEREVAGEEQGV